MDKKKSFLFTSESVTEGHPDKIADQISDAVLDSIYQKDPYARVACECLVATGMVIVAGQITTECYVDLPRVVRQTVKEIGYSRAKFGIDGETCGLMVALDEQSPDIALGVNKAMEAKEGEKLKNADATGAGDQGLMFGYATKETPEMMPMPIILAHKLAMRLAEVRKKKILPYLLPDGKTQVTVLYEDYRPVHVDKVVVSSQHTEDVSWEKIRKDIRRHVIDEIIPPSLMSKETKFYVNPTGRFVIGGPQGDTGLTGRKIIVDTYGGWCRHGGGAFSGKDPTKVDRSASYAARCVAKNIVAAGLAERCEVQLAYAIGVAKPLQIAVDTFGTGKITDAKIVELIDKHFDLTPGGIIRELDLRRPIYRSFACYGHFGRLELNPTWERTDKAKALKKEAGLK